MYIANFILNWKLAKLSEASFLEPTLQIFITKGYTVKSLLSVAKWPKCIFSPSYFY
jgi:hypothetical protein